MGNEPTSDPRPSVPAQASGGTPPVDPLPMAETLLNAPASTPTTVAPGESAGYARVRMHAQGGMGRVWLARDRRLERDVALKELRPEYMTDPAIAQRFLAEARVTGQLEHPGIVPVYELVRDGATVSYVMRFLRGRTLSEAIKTYHSKKAAAAGDLERAALLQAFIAVCQAVAFAHARGVIHRDLKGQNILLGDFGETIVVDWGLAKEEHPDGALGVEGQQKATSRPNDACVTAQASTTLPGQILGTPAYMAPEQAAGDGASVDRRSDVYSLGAILYEILTGQAPFADQSQAHGEQKLAALLRRIQDEPPTQPRQIVADVPRPLQAVCLRALAKDPQQRYQSALDLAQEVQRWLADLPVAAHPDPWTVRAARWGRRHRTLVAVVAALGAAIVVGLTITVVLLHQEQERTAAARSQAEQNFHKAQDAVDRYFTKVSEDRLLNEPGMAPLRNELLASARDFYMDLAGAQPLDPASRQTVAEAQLKLARVTRSLGARTQALKILEDAQATFEQLVNAHPEKESYELGLAQSYLDHGYQSYLLSGRSAGAEAALEKARAILDRLVEHDPSRLHRGELAHAYNTIASYHEDFYGIGEAVTQTVQHTERAYLKAVALWKQLADEEPALPIRLLDLAGGYTNLAILYVKHPELAKTPGQTQAKDFLDKALDLRKTLVRRFPLSPDYQENLAASYNNLGTYFRSHSQAEQAEKAYREAAAVREKLVRENGQVVAFQQNLARTNFNLGNLYFENVAGATGAARATLLDRGKQAYARSIELYKRLHEDHPSEYRPRMDYGVALAAMGDLMTEENQALAIPWYDQAIVRLEEIMGPGEQAGVVRRALRNSYWGRAEARTQLGQLQTAIADWDRALKLDDGSHRDAWQARRRELLKKIDDKK